MTAQQSEIKKTWQIFDLYNDSVVEIRAIEPNGAKLKPRAKNLVYRASNFDCIDDLKQAIENEALQLNAFGYNSYIVMNQISTNFHGDSVSDKDISAFTTLLIDIDRAGDTSKPASDEEIDAAEKLGDEVEAYLTKREFPKPIRTMSGNGAHLYYKLDFFPNNEQTTQTIKSLLNHLASKFNNSIVEIDTSVFNASRITKMPGTIARKGIESEGRPYRMAKVHD